MLRLFSGANPRTPRQSVAIATQVNSTSWTLTSTTVVALRCRTPAAPPAAAPLPTPAPPAAVAPLAEPAPPAAAHPHQQLYQYHQHHQQHQQTRLLQRWSWNKTVTLEAEDRETWWETSNNHQPVSSEDGRMDAPPFTPHAGMCAHTHTLHSVTSRTRSAYH